jgi:hypothetical protein
MKFIELMSFLKLLAYIQRLFLYGYIDIKKGVNLPHPV